MRKGTSLSYVVLFALVIWCTLVVGFAGRADAVAPSSGNTETPSPIDDRYSSVVRRTLQKRRVATFEGGEMETAPTTATTEPSGIKLAVAKKTTPTPKPAVAKAATAAADTAPKVSRQIRPEILDLSLPFALVAFALALILFGFIMRGSAAVGTETRKIVQVATGAERVGQAGR